MRRGFTAAVLIAALLHHALVMAAGGLVYHSADGIAHALLHWQEAGHHHHDDGSVHEDPTDESAAHVQADGALGAAAILAPLPVVPTWRVGDHVDARIPAALSPPFLEGPTRPPRDAA